MTDIKSEEELPIDSDAFEHAIAELRDAIERLRRGDPALSEPREIVEARDEVLAKYGALFAPNRLDELTAEQFREFLNFKNNKHWVALHRRGAQITEDMPRLREALTILLDESRPIQERIDELMPRNKPKFVTGLGRAILTPILSIVYPERYAVWNTVTVDAMERLGIRPKLSTSTSSGERYRTVNELTQRVRDAVGVDFWTLDAIWWHAAANESVEPRQSAVAESTVEGFAGDEWIFQANPAYFDIRGALTELEELTWLVNQYRKQIKAGQLVYFWESGSDGGILGWGYTTGDPAMMEEEESERRFDRKPAKFKGDKLRVRVAIDQVLDEPIRRSDLKTHPTLHTISILHRPNGTNFRLEPHERLELRRLARGDLPKPAYWLLAPGAKASRWKDFYDEGTARIGFSRVIGSLEGLSDSAISEQAQAAGPADTLALKQFANEIRPGDRILAKKGVSQIVGFGVVTSDYRYDPSLPELPHAREVTWLSSGEWAVPEGTKLPIKTLTKLPEKSELVARMLPVIIDTSTDEPSTEPYDLTRALDGIFMDPSKFESILDALRVKRNVIIQGPPGVGKTFVARRLAYALLEEEDPSRVGFVQFHQSMSYEDFVQGWRPASSGGFERKNGLFFDFCLRAKTDHDRPYVFIIDEINRGNLSKIFGELMMLIEPDKRSPKYAIPLAYSESGERFHVPPNVHVLGMMNTADRSLAMVDYALRRRFRFFALEPRFESTAFSKHLSESSVDDGVIRTIVDHMKELNEAIGEDTKNLGPGYRIGHSFFCPDTPDGEFDLDWYDDVVRAEILPLLEEYWFDNPGKVDEWKQKLLT